MKDILDSDFRNNEEEPKEAPKKWWEVYLLNDETIVLESTFPKVGVQRQSPKPKVQYDTSLQGCWVALGLSLLWNSAGLALVYFLEEYEWLSMILMGAALVYLIHKWSQYEERQKNQEKKSPKQQVVEVPNIPTSELILTNRQLLLEDGRQVFLDEILTTKITGSLDDQLVLELKRKAPVVIGMHNVIVAEKLITKIEAVRLNS